MLEIGGREPEDSATIEYCPGVRTRPHSVIEWMIVIAIADKTERCESRPYSICKDVYY